jgi:hypothetical protein
VEGSNKRVIKETNELMELVPLLWQVEIKSERIASSESEEFQVCRYDARSGHIAAYPAAALL